MTNTLYNPYLYNPENTYLSISAKLSYADPPGQLPKNEQVQIKRASGIATFKNLIQSISGWGYFQMEYYVIAVLIVSILLTLGFFLSSIAILQVLW